MQNDFFTELYERKGDPQHFGGGARKDYTPEDDKRDDEAAEKSASD